MHRSCRSMPSVSRLQSSIMNINRPVNLGPPKEQRFMNARPLEKASFRAPGIVRRKRVLAGARALLAHRDLDEIGLADVARAARIPKGSAYHYYGDILDLYVHLIALMGE